MRYPISVADAGNMHALIAAVGESNLRFTRWERGFLRPSSPRVPQSKAWLVYAENQESALFVYSIAEVTRSTVLLRANYFVPAEEARLDKPPFMLDLLHTRYMRIDSAILYNNIVGAIDNPVWSAYTLTGDGAGKIEIVQ